MNSLKKSDLWQCSQQSEAELSVCKVRVRQLTHHACWRGATPSAGGEEEKLPITAAELETERETPTIFRRESRKE